MEKPPVPTPRTRLAKQEDDPPKICIADRPGSQPLPGMVDQCSLLVSTQQRGKEDYAVQGNKVADRIRSLTLQSTNQSSMDSKLDAQGKLQKAYRVLLTQQSWHGDLQKRSNHLWLYEKAISQDSVHIMEWWHLEEPWKELDGGLEVGLTAFTQQAEKLMKAIHVYDYLLSERGANLQGHITELEEVANGVDKVHKGVRIAGITGGVAGAAGVAAAVGGILLAPVTFGASLAVSAVGVGVAAAGGVTGASAAITNKVHANMDRNKVETILKDHSTQMEEIEKCVKMICTNLELLKKYDLSTLDGKAVKMAKMAQKVGNSVGVVGELSKSSGLVQGFAMGLDMYFNKEDSEQLKKGSEAKFAKQIREVAKQMQTTLDGLMKFKNKLESEMM